MNFEKLYAPPSGGWPRLAAHLDEEDARASRDARFVRALAASVVFALVTISFAARFVGGEWPANTGKFAAMTNDQSGPATARATDAGISALPSSTSNVHLYWIVK